ncbi:phosphopantetheine-binding protein [Paenibacillus alginolyticus]|uniref:acyl carrier protein n=1 Tax=Paenibacillus alginolyticus TaxID=59839 RepID=UPI0004286145|nr:phosphopantetheine-binding protein [Paenibacillus alginolyticus]MCY9666524.1 phosphopantetheine-binding protein [Paenibacillus alginolyticus]
MTLEHFCQLISEISHVPFDEIRENSSFRDDLGIDSLQMVNLFTQLSTLFNVGVEVIESSEDLLTVHNLYRALHREGIQ